MAESPSRAGEDVEKVVTQLVRALDVDNVEFGPLDSAHPEVMS